MQDIMEELSFYQKMRRWLRRRLLWSNYLSGLLIIALVAQCVFPTTNTLAQPSPVLTMLSSRLGLEALPSVSPLPIQLQGLKTVPDNPFQFELIFDAPDANPASDAFRQQITKISKYFMAALALPDDQLWVNLDPQQSQRIMAPGLKQTDLGIDLLSQDYWLKQVTAALTYPDSESGRLFWEAYYQDLPKDRFAELSDVDVQYRVWIVPDQIKTWDGGNHVLIADSKLKVLSESQYQSQASEQRGNRNDQLIEKYLVPHLEGFVNADNSFQDLRQIYHAVIIAQWFKRHLKEHLLNRTFANQGQLGTMAVADAEDHISSLYQDYMNLVQSGVYDMIHTDYDPQQQALVDRRYVSGGVHIPVVQTTPLPQMPLLPNSVVAEVDIQIPDPQKEAIVTSAASTSPPSKVGATNLQNKQKKQNNKFSRRAMAAVALVIVSLSNLMPLAIPAMIKDMIGITSEQTSMVLAQSSQSETQQAAPLVWDRLSWSDVLEHPAFREIIKRGQSFRLEQFYGDYINYLNYARFEQFVVDYDIFTSLVRLNTYYSDVDQQIFKKAVDDYLEQAYVVDIPTIIEFLNSDRIVAVNDDLIPGTFESNGLKVTPHFINQITSEVILDELVTEIDYKDETPSLSSEILFTILFHPHSKAQITQTILQKLAKSPSAFNEVTAKGAWDSIHEAFQQGISGDKDQTIAQAQRLAKTLANVSPNVSEDLFSVLEKIHLYADNPKMRIFAWEATTTLILETQDRQVRRELEESYADKFRKIEKESMDEFYALAAGERIMNSANASAITAQYPSHISRLDRIDKFYKDILKDRDEDSFQSGKNLESYFFIEETSQIEGFIEGRVERRDDSQLQDSIDILNSRAESDSAAYPGKNSDALMRLVLGDILDFEKVRVSTKYLDSKVMRLSYLRGFHKLEDLKENINNGYAGTYQPGSRVVKYFEDLSDYRYLNLLNEDQHRELIQWALSDEFPKIVLKEFDTPSKTVTDLTQESRWKFWWKDEGMATRVALLESLRHVDPYTFDEELTQWIDQQDDPGLYKASVLEMMAEWGPERLIWLSRQFRHVSDKDKRVALHYALQDRHALTSEAKDLYETVMLHNPQTGQMTFSEWLLGMDDLLKVMWDRTNLKILQHQVI